MIRNPLQFFNTFIACAARLSRPALGASLCAVMLVFIGVFYATQQRPSDHTQALPSNYFVTPYSNASELSDTDIPNYEAAFAAAENGDSASTKAALNNVHNPRLFGYVLAELYLSPRYRATADELSQWLATNHDHPQAQAISRMAAARGVSIHVAQEKPLKGDGYTEHLGRSTMPDGWYHGLSLWKEGRYADAASIFSTIGADASLSPWQRAAGYYWSYRTATKLNDAKTATTQLRQAAQYRTTFYGVLAGHTLGLPEAEATPPHVSSRLRNQSASIRAALLAQLGRTEEAETELRRLYSRAPETERAGIITLAHELNLANLQVRLASLQSLTTEEELFASYPLPQYVLDAQTEQSPALLLAIARNESGFRSLATSGAGAVGLMQMLPSTAHAVEQRVGLDALQVAGTGASLAPLAERLSDPATSVRYSAEYLGILAREPAVGNNLVRVLAAYNAGPGTVSSWQPMARQINDPLLYIESIPYPETRNYVMQVLAHSWIYGGMLGEAPQSLIALAQGQWPVLAAGR